jgi:isoleucyl-tRNA synthetase
VVLGQLVLYAYSLFIWASTTYRFICDKKQVTRKRLDKILKSSSNTIIAPKKHLNKIYLTVLKHSISLEFTKDKKKKVYNILKYTLKSLIVLLLPLSTSLLSKLLQLLKKDVKSTFNNLYTILNISKGPTRPLRLHHSLFYNFLLNKDQYKEF